MLHEKKAANVENIGMSSGWALEMLTKEMTLTLILPYMYYSYQGLSKQLACVKIYLAVVWAVSLCPQACHDIIINMKIGSIRGTSLITPYSTIAYRHWFIKISARRELTNKRNMNLEKLCQSKKLTNLNLGSSPFNKNINNIDCNFFSLTGK